MSLRDRLRSWLCPELLQEEPTPEEVEQLTLHLRDVETCRQQAQTWHRLWQEAEQYHRNQRMN